MSLRNVLMLVQPMLLLNPFLFPHVSALSDLIRTRSIVQYVAPFSSVRVDVMANAFGLAEPEMMRQLEALVEEKRIRGKIDLIDRVSQILSMRIADY